MYYLIFIYLYYFGDILTNFYEYYELLQIYNILG